MGTLRTSGAAVALVLAAFAGWQSPTLLSWSLVQIVHSLWPLPLSAAHQIEAWAWREWEAAGAAARPLAPEPVPELAVGGTPASRSRPYVVRGLLNGTGSPLVGDFSWLQRPPIGDLAVDFFSDASRNASLLTPDSRGSLAEVAGRILAGGTEKLGTEMIFRSFPHLLDELRVAERVRPLLGSESHLAPSRLGTTLTVPVFLAHGQPGAYARTDLHCEPIGNLALQLGGRKRWTLVAPEHSQLLRPTLSADGRAYFVSALPTDTPETMLSHVPHWTAEVGAGDAIWVPTWTWHRVDYLPGVSALSASLFHFRVEQAAHNALYSALATPNVFKELIGWKTQ
jgi:hypothetical protein